MGRNRGSRRERRHHYFDLAFVKAASVGGLFIIAVLDAADDIDHASCRHSADEAIFLQSSLTVIACPNWDKLNRQTRKRLNPEPDEGGHHEA
jgi:hypothetical protein